MSAFAKQESTGGKEKASSTTSTSASASASVSSSVEAAATASDSSCRPLRTVWAFATTVMITDARVREQGDIPTNTDHSAAAFDLQFHGNASSRWRDPFFQDCPRITIRHKTTQRLIGMLICSGPRGVWSQQRCVVLPPSADTWSPTDKDIVLVKCYGCVMSAEGFTLGQDVLNDSEALFVTYNVAHLQGGGKQMVSGDGTLACLSKSLERQAAFTLFHATCLVSLQADVIVLQEFAGVNKEGKDCTSAVCLDPIVSKMNELTSSGMDTSGSSSLYKYTGVSTANDSRYWHPYAIISRLPLSHFTQEEPKVCQGMCGVTVQLPSQQYIRVYTSHLYYKPEEHHQQEEVEAHVKYMNREAADLSTFPHYTHIVWAGDFNNKSLDSKVMRLIRERGFDTSVPYYYVDTFFTRRRSKAGAAEQEGMSKGSALMTCKYYGPIGNFMTHKYHRGWAYHYGAHSDHLPIALHISL